MPFNFYTWVILICCCCCNEILALMNITIPAQLNREVVLPCRLPSNNYVGENVRWFNTRDDWLTDGSIVHKHRTQLSVEKPAPNEWNLRIDRVTLSFEDIYRCQTAHGVLISNIRLVIETPPRISDEDSSPIRVIATENFMATLKCTATGVPEPEVKWFRGNSEEYTGITGSLLKMPSVTRYATNEYICRAKNKHGEVERRISLDVNFAPKVSVMEKQVFASGGEMVVMSCVVEASPLYEIFWTRGDDVNGTPLKVGWKYNLKKEEGGEHIPATFLTLIINKSILSGQDYGMYSCVGKGEHSVGIDTLQLMERKQTKKKGQIEF